MIYLFTNLYGISPFPLFVYLRISFLYKLATDPVSFRHNDKLKAYIMVSEYNKFISNLGLRPKYIFSRENTVINFTLSETFVS